MVIGHNILTSLSASGPAYPAHVGVWEREGERKRGIVIVGCCVCPCISYITSDFIFPHGHNHLSLSAWPSVCIHPGFKYRFQQDYLNTQITPHITHTQTHTDTHTHTSSPASQHTLSPHFNPKSPRGQSKSSRSQSYDAGASVVSNSSHWLRITLADREGTCLWWGQLLRVRCGWLNYPSTHTQTHILCKHTHAASFCSPFHWAFCLSSKDHSLLFTLSWLWEPCWGQVTRLHWWSQ